MDIKIAARCLRSLLLKYHPPYLGSEAVHKFIMGKADYSKLKFPLSARERTRT